MKAGKLTPFQKKLKNITLSCGKQQNRTCCNHIQMMGICLMFYGESLMRPAEGKFVEIKSP